MSSSPVRRKCSPSVMNDLSVHHTIQSSLNDTRAIITCKICLKPLYEPYVLGCGHTYCYTCLNSWFDGLHKQHKFKNCPDCRKPVQQLPAPNFVLRDLTLLYTSRVELLEEGESLAEHVKARKEEEEAIAKDKDGNGLFGGIFGGRRHMPPLRDFGDNVNRCPECFWELEDGECNQCGWSVDEMGVDHFGVDPSWSDMSDEEEEELEEIRFAEEQVRAEERARRRAEEPRRFYGIDFDDHSNISYEDAIQRDQNLESEDGSLELNEYDRDDDFINDDDGIEGEEDDESASEEEVHTFVRRPIVVSSPQSPRYSTADSHLSGGRHDSPSNTDESDSEEEDVASPVPRRSVTLSRSRRAPVVISDDEEDEDEIDHEIARELEQDDFSGTEDSEVQEMVANMYDNDARFSSVEVSSSDGDNVIDHDLECDKETDPNIEAGGPVSSTESSDTQDDESRESGSSESSDDTIRQVNRQFLPPSQRSLRVLQQAVQPQGQRRSFVSKANAMPRRGVKRRIESDDEDEEEETVRRINRRIPAQQQAPVMRNRMRNSRSVEVR